MDENEKVDTFDYFNSDIKLLALHILLEGFYRGQNIFTLDQFLKGNYWKIDEISDEIRDTNDYGSIEDLVYQQVIMMVNDLKLGKIKRISVNNLSGLTEEIIRQAVNEKNATENEVMMYSAMIDEVYDLKKIRDAEIEKEGKFDRKKWNTIDFTEDNFYRNIKTLSQIGASFIEIEIDFNEKYANKVNDDIGDYLDNFYQDDFIDKKPIYRQKRFYFSKQIENFFEYIKRFPVVDGCINIPFSALEEDGFEVIKILSYLEKETRLKVRNWNDTELWNVKFHKIPITLNSLLGQEEKETLSVSSDKEIKLNLSFLPQIATMLLTDQNNNEYKVKVQGQVQKEVIRVIFNNPKNTYSEWSLYDISDFLGKDDVSETAVKNAIYQFNRKVKLAIPKVENIFELTKHSAKLNQKYINKN